MASGARPENLTDGLDRVLAGLPVAPAAQAELRARGLVEVDARGNASLTELGRKTAYWPDGAAYGFDIKAALARSLTALKDTERVRKALESLAKSEGTTPDRTINVAVAEFAHAIMTKLGIGRNAERQRKYRLEALALYRKDHERPDRPSDVTPYAPGL